MKRCGVYQDSDGRWYAYVRSSGGSAREPAGTEREARDKLVRMLDESKAAGGRIRLDPR